MGLLTDYITDRHNNQLNQQKSVLDFYANAAGGDNPDPEVNHLGMEQHMKYSGMAPKKFNDPKVLQQMMDDNKMFEEMNAKARGRQQAPPPTQSLASQGPPSAQAMQVPPPPNGGGNNYGQFAGQPSAIMGQMVAPQQPASDAMGAIAPPPQSMAVPSVPPPPSQGVDTSAVPSFRDISPTRALDRKGFTDAALKFGAQYGAEYAAKSKGDIETALSNAVNERSLRSEDLKKVQPLIDALPDHPTMKDYAKLEVGASTILGRPFQIPGVASMSKPQFFGKRSGATAPPGTLDADNQPINSTSTYRIEHDNLTGEDRWIPTIADVGRAVMPDAESKTGWSVFQIDRMGNIQGKTPNAAPPAAYAPIIRNGVHQVEVNFGDRIELVPAYTQGTSQRNVPGFSTPPAASNVPAPPPAAASGRNLGPVTPTTTPSSSITAPGVPSTSRGRNLGRVNLGAKNLSPVQVMPMKNSIEVASHQLWGDPDNPSLRPLASYANLADDQGARQRLGQALRLVLDAGGDSGAEHLGASAGPVSFSAGNLGTALSYNLGIPQAAADAKATALRDIFAKMKPEEVDYFNSLMNAIPTITGFRKLTSGGAFRWSQQGLERELPMIGLSGVTSSSTYAKKMAALGDEPLTAIKNLERFAPGAIDPRLTVLIKGGGRGVAPPGPPGAKPTNASEYLKSLGIAH